MGGNVKYQYQYKRIMTRAALRLDNQTVIAPAGQEFYFELSGYTKDSLVLCTSSAIRPPCFTVNSELCDDKKLFLNQSMVYEYDIRKLCLHQDLNEILSFQNSINQWIQQLRAEGVPLEEYTSLQDAENKTTTAAQCLSEGDYDTTHALLSESHTLLQLTQQDIQNTLDEIEADKEPDGIPGFPVTSVLLGLILSVLLSRAYRNRYSRS